MDFLIFLKRNSEGLSEKLLMVIQRAKNRNGGETSENVPGVQF